MGTSASYSFAASGLLSPKYDLKKHPNYKYTAETDKRNSFDISSLVNRSMELKPDEIYTVYNVDVSGEDSTTDEDILNYDDVDDPDAFA